MKDIEQLLNKLSPEKRRLLELKLKQKGNLANAFPLSYAQQRLWFLQQLEPESTAYHIPAAVRLKGQLDIDALQKSFKEIIKRHEILRTTFTTINGTPMQVVAAHMPLHLKQTDLSHLPSEQREAQMRTLLEEENNRPFDLTKGPLLRLHLIKMSENDHVLHILMHHIISDGWSVNVFVKEFSILYRGFLQGQPVQLPPLKIQYADFAVWQKKKLESEIKEKQLTYWKQKLGGSLPVLELPADHPRPAVKSYRGSHRKSSITGALVTQTRKMAAEHQTTVFMTLLAAFYALLYRYTQQEDMCVGIPIANRNRAETEGLIGFFVNTLVLRNDLSGEPSFSELLQRTRDVSLEAFTHQDLPFEMLVEELQPERSMSHTPLFQVMFVFQNAAEGKLELPGLQVEPVPLGNETAKFDLTLTVSETADSFLLDIEYDTDLFEASTIDRMLAHYVRLLQEMVARPQTSVSRLDMLTDDEKHRLLAEWVPQTEPFPAQKCVHQIFEEQVEKFPDRPALSFEGRQWTYRELNERANRLAHYLIRQGVKPDELIALYSEREPHLLVAILAILKAGAAYLPIDPVYPPERVHFMLEDAQARLVLTQSKLVSHLKLKDQSVFLLDDDWPELANEPETNPQTSVNPHNLIYVIYTSGSTGRPKGTLITHYNVVRLFQATDAWFGFNENDVWTLFHSYAFDFSVWEIWGAFLYGGRLVIVPQLTARAPEQFYRLILEEKITVLNQTPSAFRQLIQAEEQAGIAPYRTALRYIIFGGEALELNSLRPWFERHGDRQPQLINMYGITETTVHVTYRPLSQKDLEMNKGSVIGRPIPDLPVYILDRHLQPAPIGIPGEICVAGAGLARGYLKRPELTSTKFVPHPFSNRPGARLYRSGDLARYLEDGDIEYIGRIDNQIKIRGFRIELGEIETLLAKHPDVRECLVTTAKDARGDAMIAAYFVPEKDREITSHALREYLREKLPEYMVPSAFVLLDAFPLTPNGKIDRKALPDPAQHRLDLQREYVAPKTPTEEILAQIFADLLNVPKVGSNDHFFELGGHSLLATQLTSRIRDALGVEIALKELFEHPVVHELARAIDQVKSKQEGLEEPPIVPIDRNGPLPLSFAQQRLWFLHQLDPNDASYNIPAAFRVQGPLNVQRLQQVFDEIARRHETLRTVFKTVDGKAHVEILPESPIVVQHQVLPPDQTDRESIERLIIREARSPFDLEKGPLTRIKVLQISAREFVIVLNMHHIISDGWSMGILMNEVATIYRAFSAHQADPLPPLKIQYVDFAAWQRKWLSGKVLQEQLDYWKRVLGHGSPPLQLPTDKPRPVTPTSNGAHVHFKIEKHLAEKMNAFCQKYKVTPFMAYLAAFMVLLHKYSGQEDISVGTPIANRNRSEIENIIGFFVNTLVMRGDLSGDPTFEEFLQQIRQTALGAYAHQDLPFEKLVDAIQSERDVRHTPLFQVMFMMQNLPGGRQEVSDITIEELKVENGLSQFELTLGLTEVENGLNASLEYNTDLFHEDTIRRLGDHFVRIVEQILARPRAPLSHFSLIDSREEQRLTKEWNATERHFPPMAIHHLIEVQAEEQPEKVAIIAGDTQTTYGALDEKANRIAAWLQQKGIGKGDRVGLSLQRSPDLIAALLGILKSGAAYVPLDANYPQERLTFMIEDADIAILITEKSLQTALPESDVPVLLLDQVGDLPPATAYRPVAFSGDETAYIIYTSGSTGTPKGVMVNHRSVVNHNLAIAEIFELQDCDRVLQFATVNFDAAGEEIYPTLQNGAVLVLRGNEVLISGQELLELTEANGITIWDLPTAYWHQVLSELKQLKRQIPNTLRLLVLGGDKLSAERYKEWLQVGGKRVRTLNTYGPTEGTIDSIVFECPNELSAVDALGEIPIGQPIANTRAYVLDKHLKPVPVGLPGELFLGGACVAQGYWKRPDLTAERFLPDAFSDQPQARMYKTGDLVRWRSDGQLEYIGRTDHQVKIRGFRVELEEIEHTLLQQPGIKDAAVIAREKQGGNKQLIAYLVFKENSQADTAAIRKTLAERLPNYMVPAAFVKMKALPYLPSGKIDRRALPEPTEVPQERKRAFVAPRNEKERLLSEIWQQVLGLKEVGVEDNFFELGGDSILSIQVIARARQQGLQISPMQIFQYPTIAALASVAQEAEVIHAEQGLVTGRAPLTPIQHWFFDENFGHPEHWNQSLLLEVHEALNPDILQAVTRALLEHHDALRLRIVHENGHPVQEFAPMPPNIPFSYFDLRSFSLEEQRQAIENQAAKLQASFDLQEGCLLRMAYFNTGTLPHRLLIVVHHLAMDGISWRIILEDVQAAYRQAATGKTIALPPKTTSFKEWAQKLQDIANSSSIVAEADFWRRVAHYPQPQWFSDFPQGENREQFAAGVAESLNESETKALLTDVPPVYKTEINDILLTALVRAFARWNGKRSLLLNMEGHGREDIVPATDISRTVGWFTSLYPVYLNLENVFDPGETIKTVKEQLRAIPNNGIGYGLLRYLNDDALLRDELKGLDHAPLTFNYLGQFDQALPEESIFRPAKERKGPERHPQEKRSGLLDVTCAVTAGKLNISFTFSTRVFKKETVRPFVAFFKEELQTLIKHCQSPEAGGFTASDFRLANLDNKKLDKVLSQLQKGKKKKK